MPSFCHCVPVRQKALIVLLVVAIYIVELPGSCYYFPNLSYISFSFFFLRKRANSPSSKDEHSIGLKDSLLAHSSDPVEMRRLNYQTPGGLQLYCPNYCKDTYPSYYVYLFTGCTYHTRQVSQMKVQPADRSDIRLAGLVGWLLIGS